MNLTISKITSLSAISLFMLLSGAANADMTGPTKDFTVIGGIINNPCVVNLSPATIDFDHIDSSQITSSASVAKINKVLDVQVNNCPEGDHVSVSFTGTAASVDTTALATEDQAADAAKNVAIAFWDDGQQDSKVAINTGVSHTASTTVNGVHMPFLIGLVLNDGSKPAIGGNVSATAQVKVNFL
jgi:type 1 fimbria pilin